jgi:hypothetical protein
VEEDGGREVCLYVAFAQARGLGEEAGVEFLKDGLVGALVGGRVVQAAEFGDNLFGALRFAFVVRWGRGVGVGCRQRGDEERRAESLEWVHGAFLRAPSAADGRAAPGG